MNGISEKLLMSHLCPECGPKWQLEEFPVENHNRFAKSGPDLGYNTTQE